MTLVAVVNRGQVAITYTLRVNLSQAHSIDVSLDNRKAIWFRIQPMRSMDCYRKHTFFYRFGPCSDWTPPDLMTIRIALSRFENKHADNANVPIVDKNLYERSSLSSRNIFIIYLVISFFFITAYPSWLFTRAEFVFLSNVHVCRRIFFSRLLSRPNSLPRCLSSLLVSRLRLPVSLPYGIITRRRRIVPRRKRIPHAPTRTILI